MCLIFRCEYLLFRLSYKHAHSHTYINTLFCSLVHSFLCVCVFFFNVCLFGLFVRSFTSFSVLLIILFFNEFICYTTFLLYIYTLFFIKVENIFCTIFAQYLADSPRFLFRAQCVRVFVFLFRLLSFAPSWGIRYAPFPFFSLVRSFFLNYALRIYYINIINFHDFLLFAFMHAMLTI